MKPGLYEHYKGKLYRAKRIVLHSKTQEEMVLYKALYGSRDYWVRPKTMFMEEIEIPEIGGPYTVPRFRRLSCWQQLLLFWKR